jgi:hypothetical protein
MSCRPSGVKEAVACADGKAEVAALHTSSTHLAHPPCTSERERFRLHQAGNGAEEEAAARRRPRNTCSGDSKSRTVTLNNSFVRAPTSSID